MNPSLNPEMTDKEAFLNQEGLKQEGWIDACRLPLSGDGSSRRYTRLRRKDGQTALLMESLPDGHPSQTPGHRLEDFERIGTLLRWHGLSAPQIYANAPEQGLMLLEDFGDARLSARPEQEVTEAFTKLLPVLSAVPARGLNSFWDSHIARNHILYLDWYMPEDRGSDPSVRAAFQMAWQEIYEALPPAAEGFLYIDLHADNIMHLPRRRGLRRYGLLDFQGALKGPLAYDIAHWLYDPRRPMTETARSEGLRKRLESQDPESRENLQAWIPVMAAHLTCRCLGQFIRLARRDGKPGYLQHIPQLENYLGHLMDEPGLAPLRRFIRSQFLQDAA